MPAPTLRATLFALCLLRLPAHAADLVVLVDTGTEMPMARFDRQRLVDGVHKDVGNALAHRLGRRAVFLTLPRKRISLALEAGQGDIICAYVPAWLDGHFDWTTPFIPVTELLVADIRARRPAAIGDIAGEKVGTVLGYRYQEFDAVLGERFLREDASNAETNLRKLAAGRIQYAVTVKAALDYRLKLGDPPLHIHPPLVVKTVLTQCAVSLRGQVAVGEINHAIAQMQKEGAVAAIFGRYQ
jgi:polar amino acid transport system substrate-binding protein